MVSQRKIEANRRNAKLSTGPKTWHGKLRSSRNALKHALAALDHDHTLMDDELRFEELVSGPGERRGRRYVIPGHKGMYGQIALSRIRTYRAKLMAELDLARQSRQGQSEVPQSLDRVSHVLRKLVRLERYERRAFSKRKRLFLAMRHPD